MDSSKKEQIIKERVDKLNKGIEGAAFFKDIDDNEKFMKQLFKDNETFILRRIINAGNKSAEFFIAYNDGVVNSLIMNENIIKPLINAKISRLEPDLIDMLMTRVIQINEMEKSGDVKTVIEAVTYGDTILFMDGFDEVIILNSKQFSTRAISEPDTERTIKGPKEGFTEALLMNLSMVRRRLRTNELKMKFLTLGRKTRTKVCICYLEGVAEQKVVDELERRVKKIDMDGILASNYITELISDSPKSLLNTVGKTERPDVVAAKLLEGRVSLFVDGTPNVMTVPFLFIENFQNNEDYYLNYYYSSFTRLLRVLGFILTTLVPAFYISVVAFHHEMLPSPLLISIAIERQSVPLPAALEGVIMLIVFDILKETGVRMPGNVGHALSIVGALVIGDAAVSANLVASPMIIVVAITGITNLLVPRLSSATLILRYTLLIFSSFLGFYGLAFGVIVFMCHTLGLYSFGVPYVMFSDEFNKQSLKDTIVRLPWWDMIQRPKSITNNVVRMKTSEESGNGKEN